MIDWDRCQKTTACRPNLAHHLLLYVYKVLKQHNSKYKQKPKNTKFKIQSKWKVYILSMGVEVL